MTQYLLSVHHADEVPLSEEDMRQSFKDVDAFNDELRADGAWVFAGGLHPSSAATVVRIKDGVVLTTDGPYAETKEQMGGFWIIEAPDLDTALDYAARGARACRLPVEVRPFQEDPGA
ncbi:MAG TPA: YciI family protein [Streptosporangiaceae bacterium]|nr:YciI family protein [Streptosporangiaceae bacterium]